jgi:hypothetical protein
MSAPVRGEYTEALQRYEQSLQIAEELGDRAQVASSLEPVINFSALFSVACPCQLPS